MRSRRPPDPVFQVIPMKTAPAGRRFFACCARWVTPVAARPGWRRGFSRRASTRGVDLFGKRLRRGPAVGSCQPWLAPWFLAESIHAWRGSTADPSAIGSRQPWLAPPLAAVPSTRLPASGRHYPVLPAPKEKPRCVSSGVLGVNPGDDLLSHGLSHTTIGAAAFHFRVRDGIGWFHSANFTRETVAAALAAPASRSCPWGGNHPENAVPSLNKKNPAA